MNVEHTSEENPERIPEPLHTMDGFTLQALLKGAIDNARERFAEATRRPFPSTARGRCSSCSLSASATRKGPVWRSWVERHRTSYHAATCLTLDMAYNNARQLASLDRGWLKP